MKWIKAGEGYVPESPEKKQWRYAETHEPVLWEVIKRIAVSENNSDLVEWLDESHVSDIQGEGVKEKIWKEIRMGFSAQVDKDNCCLKKLNGGNQCKELCDGCFEVWKMCSSQPDQQAKAAGVEEILRDAFPLSDESTINSIAKEISLSVGDKQKEIDQLKISLEMAQLGWDRTTQDRDDLKNQVGALSAIKRGLEKNVQSSLKEIDRLKGLFEKQFIYWWRDNGTERLSESLQQFKTENNL